MSVLPGPYAGPYAYVRTASQPIRSKNSFRISISFKIRPLHGSGDISTDPKDLFHFAFMKGTLVIQVLF